MPDTTLSNSRKLKQDKVSDIVEPVKAEVTSDKEIAEMSLSMPSIQNNYEVSVKAKYIVKALQDITDKKLDSKYKADEIFKIIKDAKVNDKLSELAVELDKNNGISTGKLRAVLEKAGHNFLDRVYGDIMDRSTKSSSLISGYTIKDLEDRVYGLTNTEALRNVLAVKNSIGSIPEIEQAWNLFSKEKFGGRNFRTVMADELGANANTALLLGLKSDEMFNFAYRGYRGE